MGLVHLALMSKPPVRECLNSDYTIRGLVLEIKTVKFCTVTLSGNVLLPSYKQNTTTSVTYLEFGSGWGLRIFLVDLVIDFDLFKSDAVGKCR